MKLFRKLFVTYLLLSVLALVISGGFATYMVVTATARTQMGQLMSYGRDLADILQDREWNADDLRRIQSTADTLDRGERAMVWLIDREGLVRMASRSVAPDRGRQVPPPEIADVLLGQTVVIRIGHRPGLERVVAVPVFRNGAVDGAVLLSPNLDTVRQAQQEIARFTLYGAAVAALVVAIISFYISRSIAYPVTRVSNAARAVAQGDFSSRVDWRSKDEIGQLTESFNEMAAELDRLELARRDLMSTVSHELKGPLARISGFLEAINDGIGGQEAKRQHFEIVRREVGRLTRLVNDLLDFSRLEAGRLKLHPIACDLSPYITRAAEVFEAPAAAADVLLAVSVPPLLPIVDCEPERVEQGIANLLENALSFTPRGGTVSLSAREEAGELVVEVQDTGPGIPEAELSHVWERFYKHDQARTPDRRGFGLGLTIVKQLIELQGGQVFVSSEVGAGSRFGFRLPLAKPG
ncbi:MAG TPA: HAMP domain-containing sensor histidine kinase [Symbiobacteriaceae bacterium]|jgi:signal transduction histidine kinase